VGTAVGALTDEFTADDADRLLNNLMAKRGENGPLAALQGRVQSLHGMLRDMWLTPRGRLWASKWAYGELGYADSLKLPLLLSGVHFLHQGAMPKELNAAQEEILWTNSRNTYEGYMQQKLSIAHILAILSTWKGTTNVLGWSSVAPLLEPSYRGNLAYLLGHRYETRLNRPADALKFFETALRDAAPESPLQRLAAAEVQRLKKAK
jgi:hypothetical protein